MTVKHMFWFALYAAFVGAAYALWSWMGQDRATWLLAGTPAIFPVAQLALVGSVWWLGKGPRSKGLI